MLKLKNLFANFDLAKEALSHWEHDAQGLDDMLGRFRISSNAIYPFRQNGDVCFLRLAPVEEKRAENLAGEIEFIRYLREKGYPALEPAAPKAGDLPLLINTRWGKHYACAFKKAPGERVDRTDMSREIMFSYGKALGNLHVLSRAYQPKARMWSCFDALDWARAQLDAVGAPQSVRDALGRVREELAALPRNAEGFGLVHNDFEPDNVFYDAGTGVCSAIDFEDGMYHFYALDVAKALDAVEEEAPAGRFEEARDALLEGYRAQAPLGREAEELFPLMRRFQSAYAYARIAYCLAERPAEEPDWMRELCAKLEARLAALEAGMCGDD